MTEEEINNQLRCQRCLEPLPFYDRYTYQCLDCGNIFCSACFTYAEKLTHTCTDCQEDDELKEDDIRVDVNGGKYTVVIGSKGGLSALRYGKEWRDLTGDKLIFCLATELAAARERIAVLEDAPKQKGLL